MATAASLQTIQQFYVAYYGRPADPAGLEFWATQLDTAGGVLTAVLDAFGTSAEATTRYGTGTNDAKVTNLYQQILGRAPDTEGLRFYSDKLTDGTFTLATVAKRIVDGIPAGSTDATTLANKTTMANSFTDTLKTDTAANAGYSGDSAATVGRNWLTGVLDTAASVTAAQTSLAATVTDIKPVSLTLTTGVDTFNTTTKVAADKVSSVDDTISGVTSSLTTSRTFNDTDVIDGGAGTDTLKLNMQADFGGFIVGVGSMKNVEVLELTNTTPAGGTAGNRSFDATGVSGIETIKLAMNDKSFEVKDLAAAVKSVEVSGSAAAADLTLAFGTAVTGASATSDALSLTLNKVANLNVIAAGIENLSVVSATGANKADFSIGSAKTITITGSQDLTVSAVDATVTSVTASAATGKQVLDLSAATALKTVATGSANDTVTVRGIDVSANINGGAGTNELILDKITGTVQPTIAGFQTLTIKDGGTAATTISAINVKDVTTLKVTDDFTNDVTVAGLSNTALTISLAEAASTDWGAGAGKLVYSGAAALTVNATVGDTTGTISTGITAAEATSLTATVSKGATLSGALTVDKASTATITVAKDASYTGATSAKAATTVTLNVDGTASGAVTASKANTVVVTLGESSNFTSAISAAEAATVTFNSTDTDTVSVNVAADKATTLNLSTAKAMNLNAAADFSSVKNVTVSGDGSLDTTTMGANGEDFGDKSSSVTIDASSLKGNLKTEIGKYALGQGVVVVTGSSLGTNEVIIDGGRNQVTVTGGIQNDIVTFDEALAATGAYRFDLGTVSTGDRVNFTGTNDLDEVIVNFSSVDIVDTGTKLILRGADVTGQAIKFEGTALEVSGTTSADTIDLSNLVSGAASITLNAGAGNDVVTGSVKNDVIVGGTGNDSISGGDGADTITGGAGIDTMTGGAGKDVFKLLVADGNAAVLNASGTAIAKDVALTTVNAANADIITDFGASGEDVLQFDIIYNYGTAFGPSGTPTNDKVSVARGTYDSVTKIFTYKASATTADAGYATLVIYDTDFTSTSGVANTSFAAVVLVGFLATDTDREGDNFDTQTGGITGLVGGTG